MILSKFLVELEQKINNQDAWSWLLFSVNQELDFWQLAAESDLLDTALAHLDNNPLNWSPGSVSLLSTGNPALRQKILDEPNYPIPAYLSDNISAAYEKWKQRISTSYEISDICHIALYLVQTQIRHGDWSFLSEYLAEHTEITRWILSCAYGITPESDSLLKELIKPVDGVICPDLLIGVFLSNPLPADTQAEKLKSLFAEFDSETELFLLNELKKFRPDLVSMLKGAQAEYPYLIHPYSIIDSPVFKDTGKLLHQAYAHRVTGNNDESIRLFSSALKQIDALKTSISATIADLQTRNPAVSKDSLQEGTAAGQNIESSNDPVRFWKNAVAGDPGNLDYSIGLLYGLIKSGRYKEAQTLADQTLERYNKTLSHSDSLRQFHLVELLLANALLSDSADKNSEASKFLLRAYEILINFQLAETNQRFDSRLISLAEQLSNHNLIEQAIETAAIGLTENPNNSNLLWLHAVGNYKLGRFADAYPSITFLTDRYPQEIHYKKLQILTIEGINEWEFALAKRKSIRGSAKSFTFIDQVNQAYCALKAEDPEATLKICNSLINSNQKSVVESENLAHLLWLVGEAECKIGKIPESIEKNKKALELFPASPIIWISLANKYKETRAFDTQEQILRRGCQALPNSPDLNIELGKLYLQNNQASVALTHFETAKNLLDENMNLPTPEPTRDWDIPIWERPSHYFHLYSNMGHTLLTLGHYREARQVFEKAIPRRVKKNEISELTLIGYTKSLVELGAFETATPYLEYLAYSQPENLAASIDLARVLLQTDASQEKLGRFVNHYQSVITRTTKDHSSNSITSGSGQESNLQFLEAITLLAEISYKCGDYKSSNKTFRQAMSLPGSSKPKWRIRLATGLGISAIQLGEHETAISALQEAINFDTDNWQIYQHLSNAYLKIGLPEHAFHAAYMVYKNHNSDVDVLTWFADQCAQIYHLTEGEHTQANTLSVRALERAAELTPTRSDLLLRMGINQFEAGNLGAASDSFLKIAENADATSAQLLEAGIYLKKTGDNSKAIPLLEIALKKEIENSGDITPENHTVSQGKNITKHTPDTLRYQNIILELADSHQREGAHEKSISILDEGIKVYPSSESLRQAKSSILVEAGNLQSAVDNIQNLIKANPGSTKYRLQAAKLYYAIGQIDRAIYQITEVIDPESAGHDPVLVLEAKLLVADICFAFLDAETGYQYAQIINNNPPVEHYCLLAELAFELNEQVVFITSVEAARDIQQDHPWVISLVLRVAVRKSGTDQIERAGHLDKFIDCITSIDLDDLNTSLSICKTAQDVGLWDHAFHLARMIRQHHPRIPRAHFLFTETMTIISAAEYVSNTIGIVNHAPDRSLLGTDAFTEFSIAISDLEKSILPITANPIHISPNLDAVVEKINHCRLCGHAIFSPDKATIEELLKYIKSHPDNSLNLLYLQIARVSHPHEIDDTIVSSQVNQEDPLNLIVQALYPEMSLSGFEDEITASLYNHSPHAFSYPAWFYSQPVIIGILAHQLSTQGSMKEAGLLLNSALKLWPDEPKWHALCAKFELQHSEHEETETLDHITKALELEPNNPEHYLLLSQYHQAGGNLQEALRLVENADPSLLENPLIWVDQAKIYQRMKNIEQAKFCVDRAIDLARDDITAMSKAISMSGMLALDCSNPREALDYAKASIYLDNGNEEAYTIMSKAYRSLNQPAKAIAAIKKAIKTSKNPFKLDKQHLLLLKETGEATEIIDKSAELIHKYPGDPKLYADYAKILLDNDQLYEAAEASRNALRIEHPGLSAEDKAELHYIIGKHLHHEGHLDQAIHHLGESIKIDSNNSTPLVEMGLVYKARREPDLAIKKMQEAIEINKNDPWAYLEAGILFKNNNDYIQAEKMFRRAADLSPEDTNITRMLAAVVVLNLVHNQKIEKEQID